MVQTYQELVGNDPTRYHRQMMLNGWGEAGQLNLKNATVFVAGAGGLGSPASIYLAVAGVGKIRICDFDQIELSNLNRQILHQDRSVGEKKVASAAATLRGLNPDIEIEAIEQKIEADNVDDLVGDSAIIVDCMDNFPTRYLLNRSAFSKQIPYVFAAVWGLTGYLTFIHAPETPCLQCIFPEAPPKEMFPVAGVAPGVMGTLEALEAIKFLSGVGENIKNRLLYWDGSRMDFNYLGIRKDKDCPVCGDPH